MDSVADWITAQRLVTIIIVMVVAWPAAVFWEGFFEGLFRNSDSQDSD